MRVRSGSSGDRHCATGPIFEGSGSKVSHIRDDWTGWGGAMREAWWMLFLCCLGKSKVWGQETSLWGVLHISRHYTRSHGNAAFVALPRVQVCHFS